MLVDLPNCLEEIMRNESQNPPEYTKTNRQVWRLDLSCANLSVIADIVRQF